MRFALLGADESTLALARAVLASPQHELVWALDTPAWHEADTHRLCPATPRGLDWQHLLAGGADVVLVAAWQPGDPDSADDRIDAVRRLVQEQVPTVATQPLDASMLTTFEIDMIRQESVGVIVPHLPDRLHPAVDELVAWCGEAGPLGPIEQVVMERFSRATMPHDVLTLVARDVDLLRAVAGDMRRVSAIAGGDLRVWSSLTVQFSSLASHTARWSIAPPDVFAGARLTIVATGGRAVLDMPDDRPWTLTRRDDSSASRSYPDFDAPQAMLALLETALAGRPHHPNWNDACRSMELVDAIERSVARGRMVELFHEDASEESTFKGVMAASGCLLLLAGLLTIVLAAVGAQAGIPGARHWPLAFLAVLGVFLLLQTLRLAFPKSNQAHPPTRLPTPTTPPDHDSTR